MAGERRPGDGAPRADGSLPKSPRLSTPVIGRVARNHPITVRRSSTTTAVPAYDPRGIEPTEHTKPQVNPYGTIFDTFATGDSGEAPEIRGTSARPREPGRAESRTVRPDPLTVSAAARGTRRAERPRSILAAAG